MMYDSIEMQATLARELGTLLDGTYMYPIEEGVVMKNVQDICINALEKCVSQMGKHIDYDIRDNGIRVALVSNLSIEQSEAIISKVL